MSEDPSARPAAVVGEVHRTAPPSQHRRPLWVGLLLAAVVPVLLPVMALVAGSVFEANLLFVAMVVGTMGLMVSVCTIVFLLLPIVLLLRKVRRLTGVWVCGCAVLVGALSMGYALLSLSWYPQLADNSDAVVAGIKGLFFGAGLGLVAGLALVWGAGISVWGDRQG